MWGDALADARGIAADLYLEAAEEDARKLVYGNSAITYMQTMARASPDISPGRPAAGQKSRTIRGLTRSFAISTRNTLSKPPAYRAPDAFSLALAQP
jgi:hypothetical protein